MTPEQTLLVQETWQRLVPIADAAATLFYERLFETDPELRPLFRRTDMRELRLRLVQAIGMAVGELDEPENLVHIVAELGRRHAGYDVEDRHYDLVGAALLWTLERGLGSSWTPEVAEAWASLYGFLAGTMREAARSASPSPEQPVAA